MHPRAGQRLTDASCAERVEKAAARAAPSAIVFTNIHVSGLVECRADEDPCRLRRRADQTSGSLFFAQLARKSRTLAAPGKRDAEGAVMNPRSCGFHQEGAK